ncbi:MAG: D-alanyl-D-alanine carboxypeptidase family protein [Pseudomonadota bacterium]
MIVLLGAAPAFAQAEPAVPSVEDAPIAILVDVTSGQVLFSRDADRRFVPASITKAMTLLTAFEKIEEGTLDPSQSFVMADDTWREWGAKGSTMWINASDRVSVDDLLMGIANVSANDASVMLAEGEAGSVEAWVASMNAMARALGMTQSHFGTPNGWPDEGATFTTASDLVLLANALVTRHPSRYARYIGKPGFAYGGIEQPNRDPLIRGTLGADGIKTGYTNEAGFGYLGTAQRDGQRLVVVIAGAPRQSARNRAARGLIEWGFGEFDRELLFEAGDVVGSARVQNGSSLAVDLKSDQPIYVNIPKGRLAEASASIRYDGPIRAPVAADQRIATLVVEVSGMEAARIPLHAAEPVQEAGFFARIFNGIMGWLT